MLRRVPSFSNSLASAMITAATRRDGSSPSANAISTSSVHHFVLPPLVSFVQRFVCPRGLVLVLACFGIDQLPQILHNAPSFRFHCVLPPATAKLDPEDSFPFLVILPRASLLVPSVLRLSFLTVM